MSPKLATSGNPAERRYRPDVLQAFVATGKAVFKFVAMTPADFDEVQRIVDGNGIEPATVWIRPEGTDAATLTRRLHVLAGPARHRGWNLTTRLHVVLWGNERGK